MNDYTKAADRELADLCADILFRHHGIITSSGLTWARELRGAGYSKPRIITTAEDLAGMVVDSIVRTHGGVPLELWEGENDEREWRVTGHRPWTDADLVKNLPATVLYEPEPQP